MNLQMIFLCFFSIAHIKTPGPEVQTTPLLYRSISKLFVECLLDSVREV